MEAIVRQRDKEVMAANLAKLSQESQDGHIPLVRKVRPPCTSFMYLQYPQVPSGFHRGAHAVVQIRTVAPGSFLSKVSTVKIKTNEL